MTSKYGIIGWPVDHSLSPAIHNAAFRAANIDATYERLPVAPDALAAEIQRLVAAGYAGWNVTVPHKQSIMALVDDVEPVARTIGAVNTVVVQDGRLIGTNTDALGLARALEEAEVPVASANVVVLGGGGAARAAVFGLAQAGAWGITVLARDGDKAANLVAALKAEVGSTTLVSGTLDGDADGAFANANLVVQTTSATLGKSPDAIPFAMSLPWNALPDGAAVCDIVYHPRETTVLAAAKARGLRTVDGLGMLLHQAAASFERWTHVAAPVEVMREVLERSQGG